MLLGRRLRGDGLDHLVELAFDLGLEVGLDLVDLGELGERPAAVAAEMVHAGHPVGVHRGLLLLRVLAPVALDLDDQVQQVVGAVAVVDQHDEVGQVLARLGAVAVRHLEAEVVVLHVGDAPAGCASATRQNSASQSLSRIDPVDVAAAGVGLPAVGLRGVEADVRGRAGRVVGIEQRLDRALADELRG